MHTIESLMKQLEQLSIDSKGTLLVHSSMKSMGPVEGVRTQSWMRLQSI